MSARYTGMRVGAFVLALVMGLLAAWALRQHMQQQVLALSTSSAVSTVPRLVVAQDLLPGTRLNEEHLQVREMPEEWVSKFSLGPWQASDVLGAVLVTEVVAGEPLLDIHLKVDTKEQALASRLQSGERALSISATDLGGLAGRLHEGDFIDLYLSFHYAGKPVTVPLLQGMRVLALGAHDAHAVYHEQGVTLAASPQEAMRYVLARQGGTLTALLRHPKDKTLLPQEGQIDLLSLLGMSVKAESIPEVTILYADRMSGVLLDDDGIDLMTIRTE